MLLSEIATFDCKKQEVFQKYQNYLFLDSCVVVAAIRFLDWIVKSFLEQ